MVAPSAANHSPPRFFFGWTIVAFTFVVQFVTMGTVFYAYGVLLKPLTEAFDADRFLVSLALSANMAFGAAVGPLVGKWVAERSIRLLMLGGCASLSVGFVVLALAQELWHLYVVTFLNKNLAYLAGNFRNDLGFCKRLYRCSSRVHRIDIVASRD